MDIRLQLYQLVTANPVGRVTAKLPGICVANGDRIVYPPFESPKLGGRLSAVFHRSVVMRRVKYLRLEEVVRGWFISRYGGEDG
jgi:hypothetical protein